MKNISQMRRSKAEKAEEFNPWIHIFTYPRETINIIVKFTPGRHVLMLYFLIGSAVYVQHASNMHFGERNTVSFGFLLFAGGFLGLLFELYTAALFKVGQYLFKEKAQATRMAIRAAFVWAGFPIACTLIIFIIEFLLFGNEIFSSHAPKINSSALYQVIFYALEGCKALLYIWSAILFCVLLAEVQKITVLKALEQILSTIFGMAVIVVFFAMLRLR